MPNDVCNTYQGLHTIALPSHENPPDGPRPGTAMTPPQVPASQPPANDNDAIARLAERHRSRSCGLVSICPLKTTDQRSILIIRYQIACCANDWAELQKAVGSCAFPPAGQIFPDPHTGIKVITTPHEKTPARDGGWLQAWLLKGSGDVDGGRKQ